MPNANCLFSNINRYNRYKSNTKEKESNSIKNNSKSKQSVKQKNNRSFVIKNNNKKESDLNKMPTNSTISKIKKSDNQSIYNLKVERKNPFHARIKSLKINNKDNDSIYNYLSKTDRSESQEKDKINNHKNEINNIYNKFDNNNCTDISTSKKNNDNKTKYLFEDIEDSTKNTKIIEPKILNIDNNYNNNSNNNSNNSNNNNDNKILILQKNKNIKKDDTHYKKIKIISHKNKNRVLIYSKNNNIKSNFSPNSQVKIDRNDSQKEEKNKKIISNIVQKIKEKIHSIQSTIEDNYSTVRNNSNIDTFFKPSKKDMYHKINSSKNKIS